ncbi:type IV pilus twitching motility protein PilT [Alkalihalobacillus sp. MEB130]|uniref:type IV pilus twitching motility protein PilT n=1 Tax=Alkalihalobacillus sp. MEB130 TaxID=2976704 RepID=UPI0028DDE7DD|nr:type IV pilus twitching motility protein PilT [Alkalihalobacillus sp. MEB130]MDT8859517.1 type IV pilus twitching motility protein PilT [Alkalihalobacillus sp. MEB130]
MEIDKLLEFAYQNGASDLHLTIQTTPIVRINGSLKKVGTQELTRDNMLELAKQIASEEQFRQFSEIGEIDFSYELKKVCRFRVNMFKQKKAIGIVCRTINSMIPSLEKLQLPEIVRSLSKQTQGLVLVTGPTGSGKSTTLAAMIDFINSNYSKHILTLEDPIEYLHNHKKSLVNQREIGLDSQSFSIGLRAALRQDPDVILVGEMRDLDTIRTAITAAETGHLVLATLHTSSASQTIERIIDVFPGEQQQQIRTQLASTLAGVITQRLLPLADGSGRVAGLEILVNNSAVANLIRSEKTHQLRTVLETNRAKGMQSMNMAVTELVKSGQVTPLDADEYVPGWDHHV